MSCTVVAVPVLLAFNLIQIMGTAAVAAAFAGNSKLTQTQKDNNFSELAQDMENKFYEEVQHIRVCDIVEKEFQTAYMDKNILLKTLEEHGVINIEEEYEGKISGTIGTFTLYFERESENEPYILKISCKESDNAEEKINDLNTEYALNVQEDAYLNLVENLKENNMEIENEVVEDDNTIVLTINLE